MEFWICLVLIKMHKPPDDGVWLVNTGTTHSKFQRDKPLCIKSTSILCFQMVSRQLRDRLWRGTFVSINAVLH